MLERTSPIRVLAGSRLLISRFLKFRPDARHTWSSSLLLAEAGSSLIVRMLSITGLTHSPTKNRGQIQVILGPMFSGKSTELMRRIIRYSYAKHECLLIKYAKDSRYSDDFMATHDKQMLPAVKAEKLFSVTIPKHCSVIGIDEGQFFPDIVEFSEKMANQGVRVIVAALDGTFQRKAFGPILSLIPLAESVVKLNAVCMVCYGEAAFTKRIGSETEVEVIGGTEKYMAVCRKCFKAPNNASFKQPALQEICLNRKDLTPETAAPDSQRKVLAPRQLLFTKS